MDFYRRLDFAEVIAEPFPHLVIEDFFDRDLCETLIQEMPPLNVLTRGAPPESNKRFTLNQQESLAIPESSATWQEVLSQALSPAFARRVLRLFANHIRRELPDFESRFGNIDSLRAVTRQSNERGRETLGLDAQIAVNTPVLTPGTTVRGPHLDRLDKLFIGLLYLRPDHDDSHGGDLELYLPKSPNPVYLPKRLLPREEVQLVRTIPYRKNTLVLFLNTPRSLHGVSPREVTPHPRCFINLVGEMSEPLFDVPIHPDQAANASSTAGTMKSQNWLTRLLKGKHRFIPNFSKEVVK